MGNTQSNKQKGFHPYFKCGHYSKENVKLCENCQSYAIYEQYPFIKNSLSIKENRIKIQISIFFLYDFSIQMYKFNHKI